MESTQERPRTSKLTMQRSVALKRSKLFQGPAAILSLVEDPSSWHQNASNPRCGVCLFPLGPGTWPSKMDIKEECNRDPRRFGPEELDVEASASRGCTFCNNIDKFGLQCRAVELSLDKNGVSLTKSDGTITSFIFVVPPTRLYNDLPRELERECSLLGKHRLCRGLGTIKMNSTADYHVLDQAKLWWETCVRRHNCQGGRSSFTPTRLLRIEHRSDDTVIRLVAVTQPVQYVALSHRWSQETEKISLSRSNQLERMGKGILSIELPRLSELNSLPVSSVSRYHPAARNHFASYIV